MGPSQVAICNTALFRIGYTKTIVSLDELSTQAKLCKELFDITRLAVLRDHNWSFATKIKALSLLDEEVPGWDYVYEYPSDCIFVRHIFDSPNVIQATLPNPHRILKSADNSYVIIACNLAKAYIEYTADVSDTSLFDSSFVDAFAWNLAAQLAAPLTGNAKRGLELMNFYTLALQKARINNNVEDFYPKTYESSYLAAR